MCSTVKFAKADAQRGTEKNCRLRRTVNWRKCL